MLTSLMLNLYKLTKKGLSLLIIKYFGLDLLCKRFILVRRHLRIGVIIRYNSRFVLVYFVDARGRWSFYSSFTGPLLLQS